MFKVKLRTKFLLALVSISALVTWATLLLVRERVQIRLREEISQGLENSVLSFLALQQQREAALERTAALLAALPPLKAVMTSRHKTTIQDASKTFWSLAGSQLFVLADGSGQLMALHTSTPGFTETEAQQAMSRSLSQHTARDWWLGNGRLFEVFLQPIYFGSPDDGTPLGIVAVGYEIDAGAAAAMSRAASGPVAFQYGKTLVVSTVSAADQPDLLNRLEGPVTGSREIQLGRERFLATSVALSSKEAGPVTLTVLKSFDQATAFLANLNRWIVTIGFAAVLAGSLLVFWVSTTFTRPLAKLVAGVRALERGDFDYPLEVRGHDEVSIVTAAFRDMRVRLAETQQRLIESDRLATIGRMASMISHDLRHPLTAILAYSEFLSDSHLDDAQRKDFFQEIRIAVNRMTDEISSLLGFSKQRDAIRPDYGRVEDIVQRAIDTVKVLPEHESIGIRLVCDEECYGWFDPAKLERAVVNLLFNACEAVQPESGNIEVRCRNTAAGFEILVTDDGPGIPEAIRDNLFQPFISSGKQKGIGLGLTVVQKIMQDHGGEVTVEQTGPGGTSFKLAFPGAAPREIAK